MPTACSSETIQDIEEDYGTDVFTRDMELASAIVVQYCTNDEGTLTFEEFAALSERLNFSPFFSIDEAEDPDFPRQSPFSR